MKHLVFFLLSAMCIGCHSFKNTNPVEIDTIPSNGVVLNQWQIIGPFSSDSTLHFVNIDNLRLWNLNEKDISIDNYLALNKQNAQDSLKLEAEFVNKAYNSNGIPLDFNEILKTDKERFKGNVYGFCLMDSKKDLSTYLHFASTGGDKVWLNGQEICKTDYSKPLNSYQHIIPIKLHKGINTLLVKVNKWYADWQMYARLEPLSAKALYRHFELYNHSVLRNSIVTRDTLEFDPVFPKIAGTLVISNAEGRVVHSELVKTTNSWKKSIVGYQSGLYMATLKSGEFIFSHDFFKGNIHDSIQNYIAAMQFNRGVDSSLLLNIRTLIARYRYLVGKTYPEDKKFVSIFKQLVTLGNNLEKGKNALRTKGTFIKSYISDIDGSTQYYMLHVPDSYNENTKTPIAFVMPATIGKLPYLESFRVANTKLSEFLQDMADKHQIIIAEVGSRRFNAPNYNTIEENEFFAVLNEIKTFYTVDSNRIYLIGSCSGGNEAIEMAIKYPDSFAALGVVSPDVIYPESRERSMIPFISNISHLPIIDIHSQIDRHVSVSKSEKLFEITQNLAFDNFQYRKLSNEFPLFYADDFFDDALAFCKKYRRVNNTSEVKLITNSMLYNKSSGVTIHDIQHQDTAHFNAAAKGNTIVIEKNNLTSYTLELDDFRIDRKHELKIVENGKVIYNKIPKSSMLTIRPMSGLSKNSRVAGPFSHLLTRKFIVVMGTLGSHEETDRIAVIADSIQSAWFNRYFSNCRIIKDTEVSETDIRSSNLLLIGNKSSNRIFKQIADSIPLQIETDRIQIFNKTVKGRRLCVYMVYPNPLNRSKYVGIIGYNSAEAITLDSNSGIIEDITRYGTSDYKIWVPYFMDKDFGEFDNNWTLR